MKLSGVKPRKVDASLTKPPTTAELRIVGTRKPRSLKRGDVIRIGSGHARVIRVTEHNDPQFVRVGYRHGAQSWQIGTVTARLNDRL